MFGVEFSDKERADMLREAIKAVRSHADTCNATLAASLRSVAHAADKERERLHGVHMNRKV